MDVERAAENAAFRRCAAADWVRVEQNATGPAACLLANQERIQGPENGSIARFDGLGRYQTRSESTNRSSRAQFRPGPGLADSAEAAQQSCAKPGSSRQGWLFRWLALQHETQTNTVLRRGRWHRAACRQAGGAAFWLNTSDGLACGWLGGGFKSCVSRFAHGLDSGAWDGRPGSAAKTGANSRPRKRLHRTV